MQCISTYKLNILFQCANNESWKNAEIGIQSPLFMHSNWFSINQPQHMYDVHKYIFTLFAYGFCIRFFIIQWNDDVIIRFYILVCYSHSHSHSHSIRLLILVSVVSPNKVKKSLNKQEFMPVWFTCHQDFKSKSKHLRMNIFLFIEMQKRNKTRFLYMQSYLFINKCYVCHSVITRIFLIKFFGKKHERNHTSAWKWALSKQTNYHMQKLHEATNSRKRKKHGWTMWSVKQIWAWWQWNMSTVVNGVERMMMTASR